MRSSWARTLIQSADSRIIAQIIADVCRSPDDHLRSEGATGPCVVRTCEQSRCTASATLDLLAAAAHGECSGWPAPGQTEAQVREVQFPSSVPSGRLPEENSTFPMCVHTCAALNMWPARLQSSASAAGGTHARRQI